MKICLILLFLCSGSILHTEMPIEQILEEFENHRNIKKHFESTTIEELRLSGEAEPKFSALNENFFTDGSQTKWQLKSWIELSSPDNTDTITIENKKLDWEKTIIWNNQIFIEHRPRKKLDSDFVYASKNIDRHKRHLALSYMGSSLEGFVRGDLKSFVDIFRNDIDSVRVKKDSIQINGKDTKCFLLSLQNNNGQLKVWLSPEYDYNICRMESVKSEGQTVYGERLPIKSPYNPAEFEESMRPYVPTGNMTEVSFVLSNVDFDNVDGKWIARGGIFKTTTTYSDGKVQTMIHTHKRTLIDLSPDLTDAFVPNIKNGTRVYFDSPIDTVMPHFWENGKIVTRIDGNIEDIIDKEIDSHVTSKTAITEDNKIVSSGEIEGKEKDINSNISKNTYMSEDKIVSNEKYRNTLILSIIGIILLGAIFIIIKKKEKFHDDVQ